MSSLTKKKEEKENVVVQTLSLFKPEKVSTLRPQRRHFILVQSLSLQNQRKKTQYSDHSRDISSSSTPSSPVLLTAKLKVRRVKTFCVPNLGKFTPPSTAFCSVCVFFSFGPKNLLVKGFRVQILLEHGLAVDQPHPRRPGLVELLQLDVGPVVELGTPRRRRALLVAVAADAHAAERTPGASSAVRPAPVQMRGLFYRTPEARFPGTGGAGREDGAVVFCATAAGAIVA